VKGKAMRGGTHAHQERNPEQMKADERRGQNGRHRFIDVCYCPFSCVLFVCCLIVVPLPPGENPFAVE
jgi:hypothetical protein